MSARDFALWQLDQLSLPGWHVGSIKRHVAPPTDPRDLALAEQIRLLVVKNLLLLQRLVEHHSGKSQKSIDDPVQKILCVGLAQLRFLSRIPQSAAVDQAVKQSRRFGRSSAAGFVNAVLRNATRDPFPTSLPIWLQLSHPQALFQRLSKLLGMEDAIRLCERHNSVAPTIIRAASAQPGFIPHTVPGMFVVEGAKAADFAEWSRLGVGQVQDPTSAKVVDHLDLRPGQSVLDRCCGSGTKTLQVREKLLDAGAIVAIDPSEERCERLRVLVDARGLRHVHVVQGSSVEQIPETLPRLFDRVLVDIPCSNSGVLMRRAEARYRQDARHLASLEKLQREILDDTAAAVAPGGLLVYSTCSIWVEENDAQVQAFIGRHPHFEKVSEKLTLPSLDDDPTNHHDGGYVAVLHRR